MNSKMPRYGAGDIAGKNKHLESQFPPERRISPAVWVSPSRALFGQASLLYALIHTGEPM